MSRSLISPEHVKYAPLLEPYYQKVAVQEAFYTKAGLPAEGMTDFLQKWFDAWDTGASRSCRTA